MIIAIGCDHIVTPIKDKLIETLKNNGHTIIDCGTYNTVRSHYPIYGFEVARQVATKKAKFGIVICGTGVGITNSANKTYGARVCLTREVEVARQARKLYDANIIGCGGRVSGQGLIEEIVNAFINTKYEGKNKKDIKKINSALKHKNHNIKQFDKLIKKWYDGFYTEGKKQPQICLPKTWKGK